MNLGNFFTPILKNLSFRFVKCRLFEMIFGFHVLSKVMLQKDVNSLQGCIVNHIFKIVSFCFTLN